MRIIAGALKGRRLQAPAGASVRPTSDSLRETLFNVIGARVEGARILDAFAGTGAVGLEAISRGARHVTFVERDAKALRALEQNVAACRAGDMCTIVRADVVRAASRLASGDRFDVVFLDPPYDLAGVEEALAVAAGLLASGGLLVFEHSRRRPSPETIAGLTRQRLLQAGDSALSFYG